MYDNLKMNTATYEILFSNHWLFSQADLPESWQKGADESAFRKVHVPHDWSVALPFSRENSSGTGYVSGGIGWYRLHFLLDGRTKSALRKGSRAKLCFDGVYKHAHVFINGCHKGSHANGYTPFSFDITDELCLDGDNVLVVKVDHRDIADSRWFTGSGIVRKVTLRIVAPVHAGIFGTFLNTLSVAADGAADIEIHTPVVNESPETASFEIRHTLTAPDGTHTIITGHIAAASGETSEAVLTAVVPAALLWSPEQPLLYDLVTELKPSDSPDTDWYIVDSRKTGIRTIRFDADLGFFINNESRKLRGVCIHDDCGALGSASVKQVWYRRLVALKKAGCNAIRMSHNPHMPEVYELCDELGFFAMDEAFDEWEGPKNKWSQGHNVYPPKHEGYWLDFPENHKADLTAMILRDRCHPCVILWSIGNEIDYPNDPYCHPSFSTMTGNNDAGKPAAERQFDPNRPNAERLSVIARMLSEEVRAVDTTRPVTLAAAFPELSADLGFLDSLDVAGYNYRENLYEGSHLRFPTLPFLGSENFHRWEDWKAVRDHDYISGQFLWTGIDYLGEAHGWPVRASGAGILTLAGFPKAGYYRRMSFWSTEPMAHLACRVHDDAPDDRKNEYLESWNFKDGTMIDVVCYTNLSSAELFLNGLSLGAKTRSDEDDGIHWLIPFSQGTLLVKACGRITAMPDGKAVPSPLSDLTASDQLTNVSTPSGIVLSRYEVPKVFMQSGSDILQVEVSVIDAGGSLVVTGAYPVTITVTGGELIGLESGSISDCTPYTSPVRETCGGHLIVYIRRTDKGSAVTVAAASTGLAGSCIVID